MTIAQSLLGELDHEMATTKKLLERVPDAQFAYKPHERSMSLVELATHVAHIPGWGASTLTKTEVDLADPAIVAKPEPPKSTAELMGRFDKNAGELRAALAASTDARMLEPWSLKMGEKVILTQPRAGVLRGFVMNHLIHHRGQLSVYLRLLNVPVPSIYGPSADESNF